MKKLYIIILSLLVILSGYYAFKIDKYETPEQLKQDSLMVKSLQKMWKPSKLKKCDAGRNLDIMTDTIGMNKSELIDAIASGSKLTKADGG